MGRPVVSKGPDYDRQARKEALNAAFGSFLVVMAVVFSGVSTYSLLSRLFSFELPSMIDHVLVTYRNIAYPLIDWPFSLFSISLAPFVKDILSTCILVAGIIRRPMNIIFTKAASDTEWGAVFFGATIPKVGSRLDDFFNWAAEIHCQETTWWRRPLASLAAFAIAPLITYVLVTSPYTMRSGGSLGTYQSKSDQPRDMATFDTILFDGRLVLLLQSVAVVLVAVVLTMAAIIWGPSIAE